jgi:hypothetical protein
LVIARDEIDPGVRRSWYWKPSFPGFQYHVENTNDQTDLRGGSARCGSRILERGFGRAEQCRLAAQPGTVDR